MAKSDYRYAADVSTSVADTMSSLREMLEEFGATGFMDYIQQGQGYSIVAFQTDSGAFIVYVPLPDPQMFSASEPPRGKTEHRRKFRSEWERERARILRVVFALVKMKLVAANEGVTSIEKEFFSDLVVWNADGRQQTVYEWYAPQVEHLRSAGLQPPILPAIAEPKRMLQLYPKTRE